MTDANPREPLAGPAPATGDGDGSGLGEVLICVALGLLFAPLIVVRKAQRWWSKGS